MKRFLPKFITLFAIIFGTIAIYYFCIDPHVTKDLSGMRKLPVGHAYADSIHKLYPIDTTLVILWKEGMIIPPKSVLVFGDSFSNRTEKNQQDAGSENSWTHFTAMEIDKPVINIRNYRCESPEKLFVCALEQGLIPDSCIIVIETVERHLILRLSAPLRDEEYWGTYIEGLHKADSIQLPKKKNKDWLAETTVFLRFRMGRDCPTHKFHLSQPCFSHSRYEYDLYSFYEDEEHIHPNPILVVPQMQSSLDSLFLMARQHNITLFYMIAVDKYDVYEPFIVGKHKKNHLLEYFPSNDSIINTKEILLPYIQSGVKDVYRIDDTHWSPIGSKIIGEEMAKRIRILNH